MMIKNTDSTRKSTVIHQLCVVLFIILCFVDAAIFTKGLHGMQLLDIVSTALIHVVFFAMLYVIRKDIYQILARMKNVDFKGLIPLSFVLLVFNAVAISQFDLVPRYDAGLYYADFAEGIRQFDISIGTFISNFIIWTHPLHGTALFVGIGEFFAPGRMIGTYLMTMLVTDITIVIFYRLLRLLFVNVNAAIAALGCAVFAFMPFMAGMFAYFNPDYFIIFFFVWVVFSVIKGYPILTSFCGFLLLFSKEPGAILYIVFIGIYLLSQLLIGQQKITLARLKLVMPLQNILLWVAPVLALVPFLSHAKEMALIQNGTPVSASGGVFSILQYEEIYFNSRMFQFFAMSFRWLSCILILVSLIVFLRRRRKGTMTSLFSNQGAVIFAGIGLSILFYTFFISFYPSGLCPRYTGIISVFYAIAFVASVLYLFKSRKMQITAMGIFLVLNIAQTFITIDPVMTNYLHGLDLGHSTVYQVAVPEYKSQWWDSLGDIYCYNLSYSVYDELCEDVLRQIQPSQTDIFAVEDVYYYEVHMTGMQNVVYWNTRTKQRNYDSLDQDSITFYECSTSSAQINKYTSLPDKFYIVNVARVESTLKAELITYGFRVENTYFAENERGYITVYEMRR